MKPDAHSSQPECECTDCWIDRLCRNHYYTGKLLSARDFKDEQRYHVDKLRLHHVHLHGWGIVCGLQVHPRVSDQATPPPATQQCAPPAEPPGVHCIVIEAGFAIDRCGREIRVERRELDLDRYITARPAKPAPAAPAPPPAADYAARPANPDEPTPGPAGEDPECGDAWYVCLCYKEERSEWQSAPFEECGLPDHKEPNRICDSYELRILSEKPEDADAPPCGEGREDCVSSYDQGFAECARPGAGCLLLATIRGYEPGCGLKAEMIDAGDRHYLPSVALLDEAVRCLLRTSPRTHITEFNWKHGDAYAWCDFEKEYVLDPSKGLVIRFSAPLVKEPELSWRILEPMIVPQRVGHEPRRPEIAYGVFKWLDAQTIAFHPDHAYLCALRKRSPSFDLLIRLRCNLLVDQKGRAVDGNLLARTSPEEGGSSFYRVEPPTGDGVHGGLFESWLRVV